MLWYAAFYAYTPNFNYISFSMVKALLFRRPPPKNNVRKGVTRYKTIFCQA